MKSTGVQAGETMDIKEKTPEPATLITEDVYEADDKAADPDYLPSASESSPETTSTSFTWCIANINQLALLFQYCPDCGAQVYHLKHFTTGIICVTY